MLIHSVVIITRLELVPPYLTLGPIFKLPRITLTFLQNLVFLSFHDHLTLSFKLALNFKIRL